MFALGVVVTLAFVGAIGYGAYRLGYRVTKT